MRRIFKILPLILIYFIVGAKSCDNNEQVTRMNEQKKDLQARDSISSAFEKDTLSGVSLRAFEVTAQLKLNDLADYLKIMNDSTAGKAFKEKAGNMADALFLPGKKAPGFISGVIFDSVWVSRALQRVSDSVYSGQLSFTIRLPHSIKSKREIHPVKTKIVDIFTLKQEKIFGKDTVKVWNVLIGDIR
jgi:hypothetical protein